MTKALLLSACIHIINFLSQWPRGLRRWSSAARLLRSWFRIPLGGAWMFVCCECCVLSGRGFCDGLITCPEESYRLWRVVVCDQETSKNVEAKARYRAVENTATVGCNGRKTYKQRFISLIRCYSSQIFLRSPILSPSDRLIWVVILWRWASGLPPPPTFRFLAKFL